MNPKVYAFFSLSASKRERVGGKIQGVIRGSE